MEHAVIMNNKHFKILQWNIRDYNQNKNELVLLRNVNPEYSFYKETFLPQKTNKIKELYCSGKNRNNHGGGVC